MEVVKQARGHIKGAITRVHNFAQDIPANTDHTVLEVRLERLENSWQDFGKNQTELFAFYDEEGYIDPESDFEAVELKYISAKSELLKAIRKVPPVRDEASLGSINRLVDSQTALIEQLEKTVSGSSGIKPTSGADIELPSIKLEPFTGDYREWPGFRDLFLKTIDCRKNLSGSQKFRYLKSFLREEAAKLLNHLTISDNNYEQEWLKLKNRYDKPLYIINAYIESFLKLPNILSTDSFHLRKLVDSADEVIRGLAAQKSENRDPWLIYMLIGKTDIETRKAWALESKNSEASTIQDLIDFLEARCSALEACDSKNRGNKNSRANSNIKSLAVVKILCPKCKGEHSLSQCAEFLSMPVYSRRGFVRDQRLCYTCLGTKHSSARCRVKARCSFRNARHHRLVHLDTSSQSTSPTSAVSTSEATTSPPILSEIVSNHIRNESRPSGILPTAVVRVFDALGNPQLVRVLLDTGSQVSFVTEFLVKRLGIRRCHARLPISGISSVEAGVTHGAVSLSLTSRFDSTKHLEVEAYILTKISSPTPSFAFDCSNISFLQNIQLADSGFHTPGPIDMLLGADKAWSILQNGHRTDEKGNIIAHETIFGWIVTGCIPDKSIVSLHSGLDLDVILRSFWEIEEVPHKYLSDEDPADAHFAKTLTRTPDNKYMVELPFRQDKIEFGNTISGALSRLFAMERRFSRNPDLKLEYRKFMKTYHDLGHMERIPEDNIEPTSGDVFYLPHHAVITNKIRVVFDGSHKDSNGTSLNEMLHIGTPLQRNLINVCVRFRMHKYVFCADIVKMFRQIWVHPKHRDYQRIVWRESPDEPIAHFRLCTVTYGTSPAPYLSMRVLRQLAVDYKQQFPLASHAILQDMYVDDIMTGSDSVSATLKLKNQLVEMLSCGGLELSKWSSNCWSILSETDYKETVSLDLDNTSQWTKVLGLVWNPQCDIFTYKITSSNELLPTKRKLLSEVAKIFDPLGFLAPSTILFKILFQELWVAKIGWDDPLPVEVADKWKTYRGELSCFENFRIPRRCTLNSNYFELIGFSDASEKAYSAVVYSRSVSDGAIEVRLVAAKTRVAPLKQISIPRLELCGAVLLCRLMELIRSSLDTNPIRVSAYSDSQIVLCWLSSSPRRWNTFVANRTSEVLATLPRSAWNYVRSAENPADCASRGIEPKRLMELELWWKGPVFLYQDFNQRPMTPELPLENLPEERKNNLVVNTSSSAQHLLEHLSSNVSSWRRLLRIVCFVFRFVHHCKTPSRNRSQGRISFSEFRRAKDFCLMWSQIEFNAEILALKGSHPIPRGSKISSLSPFIDEVGLLRVGGRIANAKGVPFAVKHPIVLPKHHRFAQLILLDAHRLYLHIGVSGLFAIIRQEYWIIGSRNMIRKIVHDCITCFRLRQSTSSQIMGNLPSSRVDPSFAFVHTGCDYAGPITLRLSKGRNPKLVKGYIAVFVCMTTKAIHLEVVSDLTTDAFLAALKRFIARRGRCSVMYSDNGSNFQGAARVLCEMSLLVQSREHQERVAETLATEGIKWEFIPPYSPHFGGLWEAGVKLVKQHLRRVIGNNILTFEEICTLLAQIEALLNSRPLCAISDSDLNPLTPSHFLIGRPYTAVLEPSYLDVPSNRLGRWEAVQNMMQGFWRRWQTDYLTSLQQRPKWRQAMRDFRVGDLVVIKEPNLPPSQWSLGRIEEVHPGQDGHVRVVTLRAKNGRFKRPITKLAVLPIS